MFAIRQMRERAGMTQQDVAATLGVTTSRYGSWEREDREINLRDATTLADLFRCSLEELAGRRQSDVGDDEAELLRLYRSTDSRGRAAIMRTAIGESGVEGKVEADIIA